MYENIVEYYNQRAKEYDKVYSIPAEQNDLTKAIQIFQNLFTSKNVLEIACGTGFWTSQISKTATSIYATDINETLVKMAKERASASNVKIEVADMNNLETIEKYDAYFGGFIWSHILLQELDKFIINASKNLIANSIIAFIDSKPVPNSNHDKRRITKTDKYGNTFQARELDNGITYSVLKNFPTKEFLEQKMSFVAEEIQYIELEYYWILISKLK